MKNHTKIFQDTLVPESCQLAGYCTLVFNFDLKVSMLLSLPAFCYSPTVRPDLPLKVNGQLEIELNDGRERLDNLVKPNFL